MEELKCPHCKSKNIEIGDWLDMYYNGDVIVREYCGFCRDCETNLTWEENYKFESYSNIKIDS